MPVKITPAEASRRLAVQAGADAQALDAQALDAPDADALTALKADCATPVAACDVAADWLREPDEPERPIVAGLVDQGDRTAIVGQSKAKKSFFALQFAVAVATGTPFLGYAVTAQKVLLVNGEIRRAPYKRRLRRMVASMRIDPASLLGMVVFNTADQVPDSDPLGQALRLAVDHLCEVVILDPFYLSVGDEQDQNEVKRAVGAMKLFAVEGKTLVSVFHASKGSIGDRQAVDRISGSGIFARDCSSMLTLCEHATEPDHIVLATVTRNHAPQEPLTIRFEDGRFELAGNVAPVEKTSRSRPVRVIGKEEVAACFSATPLAYGDSCAAIKKACCVGTNRAKELLAEAVRNGTVLVKPEGRRMNYTLSDVV